MGVKGLLYLLGVDVDVLPRYTADVAYKDRGAAKGTVKYLGGLIDEAPGWGAALVLDMIDLGQPLNAGLIGVGQMGRMGALLTRAGIRAGVSKGVPTGSEVWLQVIKEASPTDTVESLLRRAREMDPTLTGDVESVLETALLDRMGSGDIIEGNMQALDNTIRGLQKQEGELGGKISKALNEAQEALDTETEIAELAKIIKEGEGRSEDLAREIVAQERLRKRLEKGPLDVEPEVAPVVELAEAPRKKGSRSSRMRLPLLWPRWTASKERASAWPPSRRKWRRRAGNSMK